MGLAHISARRIFKFWEMMQHFMLNKLSFLTKCLVLLLPVTLANPNPSLKFLNSNCFRLSNPNPNPFGPSNQSPSLNFGQFHNTNDQRDIYYQPMSDLTLCKASGKITYILDWQNQLGSKCAKLLPKKSFKF